MGGGKGGSSGSSTTTIRYAPYVESYHQAFLAKISEEALAVVDDSPFTGYTDIDVDTAFFGTGYLISSFPSLYDMYGKFMAGLDIEVLWAQNYEDTVNAAEVDNTVTAEADLIDDDIEQNVLPRFETGMRDLNAVMTSSYVVGKSLIESARVKQLAKFDAELRYRLIPVAEQRWQAHLQWNHNVVLVYAELMKLYYSAKQDITDFNYSMDAKDKLWPFTVLEYERAALGALQGATNSKTEVAGASKAGKAIAGAMGGAAMGALAGAQIGAAGGPITAVGGAVIGGVLGLAGGLLS